METSRRGLQAKGKLLIVEPPHKLIVTWQLLLLAETAEENPSPITWKIEPHVDLNGVTFVTVIHDNFEQGQILPGLWKADYRLYGQV